MGDPIAPDDVLLLEPRKVVTYLQRRADGSHVFRVSYGTKVIEFDGPTLPFGQRIFQNPRERFRAADVAGGPDATDGQSMPWDEAKEFLESLVEEGILRSEGAPDGARDDDEDFEPPALSTDPQAPMPPVPWHTLNELCAYASGRLGHSMRPEVVETSFGGRAITQSLRDEDGRQGGENGLAMVMPAMSDPVPTEWRPCKYRGTRFADPRPMNVSALRQLHNHMPELLAVLSAVRAHYLKRSGRSQLALGHLSILAEVLNVLPAWLLVRPHTPMLSGKQPAWVHTIAKTVAGIDVSLRYLADESEEHDVDATVTAGDILRAAEFGGLFATGTGVCSGSVAQIDRADRAFTGEDVIDGGDAIFGTIGAIDEFLEYGLAWCRLQSARMIGDCRALVALEAALESDPLVGAGQSALEETVTLERQTLDRLEGSFDRRLDLLIYRYQGADALLSSGVMGAVALPAFESSPATTIAALSELLDGERDKAVWANALAEVLAHESWTLTLVRELQQRLNGALGRANAAPVGRADLVAARRLRDRELLSDRIASALELTIHDRGERGVVVEGRGASVEVV